MLAAAPFRMPPGGHGPLLHTSHATPLISSTISGLSCWMQSKGHTRMDAGNKGQSLKDGCILFVQKFFFQTQNQGQKQAEEPLSVYVIEHLCQATHRQGYTGVMGREALESKSLKRKGAANESKIAEGVGNITCNALD
ncbi:hypothetical protein TNCV_2645301 [Trichonephila clavipes]|nr:hypothetical protein TNCV_2645301 [Trichonephila clavipes]